MLTFDPPSSRPVGFGIVGAGLIAKIHAQAICAHPGARFVGVASRNLESARDLAELYGATLITESIEILVNCPEIDVICITTPSGAHLEPVMLAARAGCHVLVEKPLEVSLERVDRMIEVCREAGVVLASVFQARLGTGAMALKRAIESGRFGRLALCDAYVKWFRDPSYYQVNSWRGTRRLDGGGALMNQSIHAIDLLQWLVGMPVRVGAFGGAIVHRRLEVEDTGVAVLQFPDGALGVIEGSTAAWPGSARRIEIVGELGSAALEDDRIVRWDFRDKMPEDEHLLAAGGNAGLKSGAASAQSISFEGHRLLVADLLEALKNGRRPAIDGREGRNAVAVVEAIYRSAASGRIEAVN